MTEENEHYIEFDGTMTIVEGNRFDLLQSELEAIAANLQPNYSGRLVVERCMPKGTDITYVDWQDIRNPIIEEERKMLYPFLAIREKTEEKKWFGLVKKENSRLILGLGEVFTGEEDGYRQLDVLVADEAAEEELRKQSKRIAEDHGLTGISIARMQ